MLLRQTEYSSPPARYTGGMHPAGSSTSGKLGSYNVSHRPYPLHTVRLSAMQLEYRRYEFLLQHLTRLADVGTIIPGSLHGSNGRASTILEGLIFVTTNAHDQQLKLRTICVLCNVTLTTHFLADLQPSRCRRSLAVPATNVAMLATTPRFALQLSASATTASNPDTSRTSALSPGRLRPSSATTVKDWVTFRPTAQL